MSDTEDLGINLDSSIKKLLKEKCPNQSFRNPVVKAIAVCTKRFLEEIIQESANIGLEKQKDTMIDEHIYEAIERMKFNSLLDEAKSIGEEIKGNIKTRKEDWKTPKEPKKSIEERKKESEFLMQSVMLELQKKKQAEAAAAALKKTET